MLIAPRTLEEFYSTILEDNGIKLASQDVMKIAEARGEDPVKAKLAEAVYNQTLIDCLEYASRQERVADSVKMAEAYMKHIEDSKAAATKVASDLLRVATFAVEGYLAQNGISQLTAAEGVKIAMEGPDALMAMLRDKEKKEDKKEEKEEKKEEK